MNPFQITLNEDTWNIYLVDDNDHVISEESAAAHTDFDKKEAYFRSGDLSFGIVKHEVWHMNFGYCYLSDTTEMSISDLEEVSSTLFEYRAEKMLDMAKDIYNKLVELRDYET